MAARIAQVGDPDLDPDLTTKLLGVLVQEAGGMLEVVISIDDGSGSWDDPQSEGQLCPVDGVQGSIALKLAVNDRACSATRANVERIRQWGDVHASVRIVSAPGCVVTMYGPDEELAFLPRWKRAAPR